MEAQQLLDYIIIPTLKYMGGNYDSKNARMLLLSTAAIESNCGYYIKQINGPAIGVWQMEPKTHSDINLNCDVLFEENALMRTKQDNLYMKYNIDVGVGGMVNNPMYACFMARLKYSMDKEPLPPHDEIFEIYRYYKRIYNTVHGKSTFEKFKDSWKSNKLYEINLGE